jgi:hypothetical protein
MVILRFICISLFIRVVIYTDNLTIPGNSLCFEFQWFNATSVYKLTTEHSEFIVDTCILNIYCLPVVTNRQHSLTNKLLYHIMLSVDQLVGNKYTRKV